MRNTLSRLGYVAATAFILTMCVSVHEFGHLLAGMYYGLDITTYSIGMGPALLQYEWQGLTWQLASIPFGGYCEFAEGQVIPPAVALAGPLFGALLAIPAAWPVILDALGADDDASTLARYVFTAGISLLVPLMPLVVLPWYFISRRRDKQSAAVPVPESRPIPNGRNIYTVTERDGTEHVYRFGTSEDMLEWVEYGALAGDKAARGLLDGYLGQAAPEPEEVCPSEVHTGMTGPVGIVDSMSHRMEGMSGGWGERVGLLTLVISLALSYTNILPLPPLDGSHIMLYYIPMSTELHDNILAFGGVVLLTAMLLFTGRDIYRIVQRRRRQAA